MTILSSTCAEGPPNPPIHTLFDPVVMREAQLYPINVLLLGVPPPDPNTDPVPPPITVFPFAAPVKSPRDENPSATLLTPVSKFPIAPSPIAIFAVLFPPP